MAIDEWSTTLRTMLPIAHSTGGTEPAASGIPSGAVVSEMVQEEGKNGGK